MSWDSLATALHDRLCDDLSCAEYFEESSYVDHGLSREWWTATAQDVEEYVKARVKDQLPENILINLRSHHFKPCRMCGVEVDLPEALYECGSV